MRQRKGVKAEEWPRRKTGEPIFRTTQEAIYFANVVEDRLATYNILKKGRERAHKEIALARKGAKPRWNRLFELAVRGQFYRECMEEIERLNEEGE